MDWSFLFVLFVFFETGSHEPKLAPNVLCILGLQVCTTLLLYASLHSFCSQHLEWSSCPSLYSPWVSSRSPRQHGDAEGGGSERLLTQGHLRIWQWVLSLQSSAGHDTALSLGCTGLSIVQPWRFAAKESETCHCKVTGEAGT